ncbi:DUF262 domain-containing protein [Stakelama tenebrarum]|uniref:DUF262 domain-containing protein n=1 Tax=Stakelama tenebrarum TaxID=2711215 RepID=A0A6G6Y243_9SPHN|nr:DUF262 domain-containing protein [Sphingosinithalassobacter tenebrarum]QIG78969.1 DUF262 domain-containing protein [Sphingosinithalassobacter tenebrarum]
MFIRQIIERISSGDIRIPAFQRGYVWEPEQAAFLLDSIYKGFPIGTVVLWQTDERLEFEKNLGSFVLPDPKKDYPVNYVLDGQQRLTSIFSVFQTELQPEDNQWTDIYFDLFSEESLQESVFKPLSEGEVDPERHFPVKTFYSPIEYRKACDGRPADQIVKLDSIQERFKEYDVQTQTFETDDRNKVAIVFERINRAGTELKVFELLSAWSWSDDFDLTEKFSDLQDDIEEHGYGDLSKEQDLQLRICAGVITEETSPEKIMSLSGEEIRNRFGEIRNGITGAIDFLKRELSVRHFAMLPFPGMLIPLSCFFSTDRDEGVRYEAHQREELIRWFWRTAFSRRYSSDVNSKQAADINEFNKLKNNPQYQVKQPAAELKVEFDKANFLASSANSKTLICMLAQKSPKSLISGAVIELDKVLKRGMKHEFHHIYPQRHLGVAGYDRRDINVLANICFLTRQDNNYIKAKAPSVYAKDMPAVSRSDYLERAIIPEDFDDDDYDKFRAARTEALIELAAELMS